MSYGRKNPRLFVVVAILIISLVLLSLAPVIAAARPNKQNQTTFGRLVSKVRQATHRWGRLVSGRGGRAGARAEPLVAVKAVPKGEAGQTASVFKPTPTPPMPAGTPEVAVSGSGAFAADVAEAGRMNFAANQTVAVGYAGGTYYLLQGGRTLATSNRPIKLTPVVPGAILSLPDYKDPNWNNMANLNAFRGNIEVAYSAKSGQLWAVNELSVEDYLRGMAEASADAPEEHLKVMAIVSRSYVVHHLAGGGRHPGEPFQLKNSRNGNGDDQVYRGYNAETRQPRIAKSVGDTAGTVVTYQGKPVITPYSTCPGGRTLSPAEARWNVDWPWVRSVPDPDTAGMPRNGHGVGLSGIGSRKRAERGETAAQILGYYFSGTSLGQVDTAGQIVRVSIYGQPAK